MNSVRREETSCEVLLYIGQIEKVNNQSAKMKFMKFHMSGEVFFFYKDDNRNESWGIDSENIIKEVVLSNSQVPVGPKSNLCVRWIKHISSTLGQQICDQLSYDVIQKYKHVIKNINNMY